jgi:hypothetical protein
VRQKYDLRLRNILQEVYTRRVIDDLPLGRFAKAFAQHEQLIVDGLGAQSLSLLCLFVEVDSLWEDVFESARAERWQEVQPEDRLLGLLFGELVVWDNVRVEPSPRERCECIV